MNTFNKLGPGHLTFFLVAASSQLWGCSGGKTSELARVKQLTDVKVAPNSPTALSLSHSHSGQAELTWTASSLGNSPISYQVLRSTSVSGPFSEVVSGLTATTYTDSNLINNVTYYYQIKATNSVGTSAATSPQSVVVDFKKQLDFDFTTLSIAPVSGSNSITFNRSGTQSAGTYHDSTGRIIRTSTNYFLHSNNFLHSAWDHVSATLTPNATTAPDGTNSAWLMQANPVNKGGVLGQLKVNGYITYAPFTVSFYVKKINHRYVGIKISLAGDLTSNERIPFVDLDAAPGAGTIPGTPSRPQAIRSVAVGGGWYRVSASYLIEPGTPTVDPDPVYAGWADLTFTTADGTTNYTSAGTEQLYVWHPQNEANWEPTEYQATEGAPVINTPRFDYHPTTHAFRGLMIEEQRKNLIPFSESAERHSLSGGGGITRVVDSAVAPSGAPIADAISGNDTNAFLDIQGLDLSPATVYTRSIFVKKTSGATVFPAISSQYWNSGYSNLQTSGVILNTNNGTAYANSGWGTPGSESRITVEDENSFWRVSFTSTSPLNTRYGYLRFYPAANTTGTDGTALATSSPTTHVIWGDQLEVGQHATSYISSYYFDGTTRGAETLTKTSASWLNPESGTMIVEGSTYVDGAVATDISVAAALSDGTENNFVRLVTKNSMNVSSAESHIQAGSPDYGYALGSTTLNTSAQLAVSYRDTSFFSNRNGGSVDSGTGFSPAAAVTRINIGSSGAGTKQLNGWLRKFRYYDGGMDASELLRFTP